MESGRRGITIPGCWNKITGTEAITDQINWRFCGGFFMGDRASLETFSTLVWEQISVLSPTWEVNVWAWVEHQSKWKDIHWYSADHNDSMICNLPASTFSANVRNTKIDWGSIQYPVVRHFKPSSISYCYFQGRHITNVRFINYHLLENGTYYYPGGKGVIENINMVGHLDETEFKPRFGFTKMRENNLGIPRRDAFSQGLEDIRLFECDGTLKFIATTVGYSREGINQMIWGDYDDRLGEFRNGCIVESDNGCCEKNWIPLPDGHHFIYSWAPYRVGKIEGGRLVIVDNVSLSFPLFEKVRGSTIFVRDHNRTLGVVHFSENESPRHYFHMLILLDETTNRPLFYSQPFHFYEELGIEFCIGFCIRGDEYCFWVSRFDRDPKMIILSKQTIENLFIL
jgi:hypothetical protein